MSALADSIERIVTEAKAKAGLDLAEQSWRDAGDRMTETVLGMVGEIVRTVYPAAAWLHVHVYEDEVSGDHLRLDGVLDDVNDHIAHVDSRFVDIVFEELVQALEPILDYLVSIEPDWCDVEIDVRVPEQVPA